MELLGMGALSLQGQMSKLAGNMSRNMGYNEVDGGQYMVLGLETHEGVWLAIVGGLIGLWANFQIVKRLEDL